MFVIFHLSNNLLRETQCNDDPFLLVGTDKLHIIKRIREMCYYLQTISMAIFCTERNEMSM